MNIVFFSHPDFQIHQSMPRYTKMLANGMLERGHTVKICKPKARFNLLPVGSLLKKWLGYIDQYLIFPLEIRLLLMKCDANTLFVFTDHALGPWVPLLKNRPHIIHCHDFLAQQSAFGKHDENVLSITGREYQKFIKRGYSAGKNFISVSRETKKQLHEMLGFKPKLSEVVYNGVNPIFQPMDITTARKLFWKETNIDIINGFILHVGGNQWYKNRKGIIEIYNCWRLSTNEVIPLVLIGELPSEDVYKLYSKSRFKNEIHFLNNINDEVLKVSYAAATLLLFPSLAEGFGWPIAEAMACGCPVITTNEAPMTEVAGNEGFFIAKKPSDELAQEQWSSNVNQTINYLVSLTDEERSVAAKRGINHVKQFESTMILHRIEAIYEQTLNQYFDSNDTETSTYQQSIAS